MTSLANIFTKEKALVKIIFGHKIIICQSIFKIFVVLFMTFEMQKDNTITFLLDMFQKKVKCKNAVSKGWCKECSHLHYMYSNIKYRCKKWSAPF